MGCGKDERESPSTAVGRQLPLCDLRRNPPVEGRWPQTPDL